MGKVYSKSQKKTARTERRRRRNLGPHEWDGFQGRGQRAQQYWWDLPDRKRRKPKTKPWTKVGKFVKKKLL